MTFFVLHSPKTALEIGTCLCFACPETHNTLIEGTITKSHIINEGLYKGGQSYTIELSNGTVIDIGPMRIAR